MHRPRFLLLISFLATLFLVPSCSESPTGGTDTLGAEDVGQFDPNATGEFLLGAVTAGAADGRVEVWASNLLVESASVSFDARIINTSRTDISGPVYWVITDVQPPVVSPANPDYIYRDGSVYDFSDDVGDDGVLSAGEVSDPVRATFNWPEPIGFSIGFRVGVGTLDSGFVSGIVFDDANQNGQFDPRIEHGIPGIRVDLIPSVRENLYTTKTDRTGNYVFSGLAADVYRAKAFPGINMQATTSNPRIVTLVERPDGTVTGISGVNFGFAVPIEPPPGPALFGPVAVGPGSPNGTELDSMFVVPDFFAAVDLYLKVVPPPLLGPLPIHIDEASVRINDAVVWDFTCEPADSFCTPAARVLLDPEATGRENTIGIRVLGDERSFLMFSIEARTIMPPR